MYGKVREGIACIFPVLFFSIICPAGYMLMNDRDGRQVTALWLGGSVLFIVTVVSGAAVKKCRTSQAYLALTGAGTLAAAFLALKYREQFLPGRPGIAYLVIMAAGTVLILMERFGIRTREARRKKALLQNDITWEETKYILEEPRPVFVLVFFLIYLAAAFYAGCPEACDIAMASGVIYLILSIIWRYIDGMEVYLKGTLHIANVPVRKIRRVQAGVLLTFLVALLAISVPAILLGRMRMYHDARGWHSMRDFSIDEAWEENMPDPGMVPFDFGPWEESDPGETAEPPAWLEKAGWIMAGLFVVFFLLFLLRMIYRQLLDFRDGYEENGDIAENLEEDITSGLRKEPFHVFHRETEEDRIRRRYRRTIRRYLKGMPRPGETPEEIENRTDFPQDFDIGTLHVQYEKARYGKEENEKGL